ncbi:hypothetical protein BH10PLA1_BH10PLA1_13350 [soil metagenome]
MIDSFERFVAALHRRAVVWSVVERTGITLAGAAGVAGVLTIVGVSEEVAAGPIMIGAALIAVIAGVAWGILRRPNRLEAVMKADRQLNLQDLLSSALLAPVDDFGSAVRVMARRACAKHSPGEIVLHRLGVRAWGGIGLAWAMVTVLSLLAGSGADSRANNDQRLSPVPARPRDSGLTSAAEARRASGGSEASSDDFSHAGAPQDASAGAAAQSTRRGHNAASDASGEASSQTNTAGKVTTDSHGSSTAENSSSTGAEISAGRSGSESANGPSSSDASIADGTVITRRAVSSPAPWDSDHWPADRTAALQAIHDGRVPPAYRDLVQDYFTPSVEPGRK